MKPDSKILLLDCGRYTLWLRLLAVAVALVLCWFGIAITANHYFRIQMGLGNTTIKGSPLTLLIFLFALGLAFLFVWFAQSRIYFDPALKSLFVEGHVFFRWHGRTIPLTDGCEFHIRFVSIYSGGVWELSMNHFDGSSQLVLQIPYLRKGETPLHTFRDLLEENTGWPVVLHERNS